MTAEPMPSAAFVGLGAMGAPMARHLAARGALQAVWNRSADKAQALAAELGVAAPATLAELAPLADVIFLCVSADADVRAVVEALKPGLRAGQVVVDTSTVSRETALAIAGELAAIGADFLDAPLTGGVEGAKNGRLSVMVGGDAAVLVRVRPLIEAFAARITHMGAVGAGQASKAVNQVLVAGIAQGVCEGLAFAEALGLPTDKLLDVLTAGAANAWFLEKRGRTMLADQFEGGFKLALLHKDLGIVRQMADALGAQLPIVDQAHADYAALKAEGRGDEEISALIRRKRQLFPAR